MASYHTDTALQCWLQTLRTAPTNIRFASASARSNPCTRSRPRSANTWGLTLMTVTDHTYPGPSLSPPRFPEQRCQRMECTTSVAHAKLLQVDFATGSSLVEFGDTPWRLTGDTEALRVEMLLLTSSGRTAGMTLRGNDSTWVTDAHVKPRSEKAAGTDSNTRCSHPSCTVDKAHQYHPVAGAIC